MPLRPEPSTGSAPAGTLSRGQVIDILGWEGGWYYVRAGRLGVYDVVGYVPEEQVTMPDSASAHPARKTTAAVATRPTGTPAPQIDTAYDVQAGVLADPDNAARLVNELGDRGHRVEVRQAAPSKRLKRNPLSPDKPAAPVVKDASFVLSRYPDAPILFTSSTIDAFGRAKLIDESEAVREDDLLQQVLSGRGSSDEKFDIDLMFWFNGWATLFSAVHMCLGNVYEEGLEVVLKRQRKDPLSLALRRFDLRLLDFYRERADDLDEIISGSTGPHHLFHTITEDGAMRLHMTRRLIEAMT